MVNVVVLAGRAIVILAIISVGLFVSLRLMQRAGLEMADPFEATTWHGRPINQDDHEPQGPRFGFVIFLLIYIALLVLSVTVADLLFG